jgi:hypothetical protein
MRKTKKSDKLIKNLKTVFYFSRKAEEPLYCWRFENTGLKYTDAQRDRLNHAQVLHGEAQKIVKEVYAEIIGKQIIEENT